MFAKSALYRWTLAKLFPGRGQSGTQRVIHAGFWAVAFNSVDQVLIFARFIALAVLLSPRDFGVFGIGLVTLAALDALTRPGIRNALIQKSGDIEPYVDVAWTLQMTRGVVVATFLWIFAPWVAAFVDTPDAEQLMRVLGVIFLIQEVSNPRVLYFHRDLEFHKDFHFRVSGALADLIVALVAAFWLRNYWALVLGFAARNCAMFVVSYQLLHYRPRIAMQWHKLKELLNYGVWVWLTGLLNFIVQQGASVVVGKSLGASALGWLQMAQRIPSLALQQGVINPMASVAFPAYAKIRGDHARLRHAFLRVTALWAAVTLPMASGIAAVGGDFTRIFLGEKWLPMVPALILLSIALLVRSLVATAMPLFMGQGRPRLAFYLVATEALTLSILIYPFVTRWGITGAGAATLIAALVALLVWYAELKNRLQLGAKDIAMAIGPPLLSVCTMLIAVLLFRNFSLPDPPLAKLLDVAWFFTEVTVGAVVYVLSMQACQWSIKDYAPLRGIRGGFAETDTRKP